MIYNFFEDFCQMKTTIYTYGEKVDENGNLIQLPLSRNVKKDAYLKDILCEFKYNWLFKDSKYGHDIKDITFKARSYAHGSIEYNDIKMHMPGFTWNGCVKKEDRLDELNQEFYEVRCKRTADNIELNGLVCIEFDDVESKEVPDLIQKAIKHFPHLIYAGKTLSNKLFCMHRADNKLKANNYILYFMELAVQYYNTLGIKCDTSVNDVPRIRYMCDQCGSRVACRDYCDFGYSENIKVEYDKIFSDKEKHYVKRISEYIPKPDDTIYEYDENKGFYYGHQKQHLHKIGELIVPVPSIEQMINTLVALGKTSDEIIELWKSTLNYYNYNTCSRNITDNKRLTVKIANDKREFKVGDSTYTFLLMFFPQIIGTKSLFLSNNEFLCDRYYNVLLNSILTNKRILIHGDTGIGKTYFANKLSNDKDVIVVVPYIAHMKNYPEYEQIEIKDDMPIIKNGVIIWDRFVKLYKKELISKNSIIIIDESHKLFLDQTYRHAAIFMNDILRDIENNICYISATPINEINVNKIYRFEKERRNVRVNHLKIIPDDDSSINDTLTLEAILHLIYGNLNYYDHIFIASDHFAQKIYDRLYGRYDCQLIRASQKESNEFLQLMKDQLLKHKIIIGTCISYESLNFNNKNEKILTIADMNNKTTSHTITQIAGRVRFSYNQVYLIECVKKITRTDFKEEVEYLNKLEEIKNKYNLYTKKHYIQNYYNELEEVNNWYLENNNIDKIKEDLPLYIKWEDSEISAKNIYDKSPLNEHTKKYIIDYISTHDKEFNNTDILLNEDDYYTSLFFGNDNFIHITENGQSGYIIRENIREQQYSYGKLMTYVDYHKINKLITEGHTMPKGVNGEIFKTIDIISLDEMNYNMYISELEKYCNTLKGPYYLILNKVISNIKNTRKKYIKCKGDDEYSTYNNIFDVYLNNKKKLYNHKIDAAKKKIKDLTTNIIYDSVTDCAKAINHNRSYISKHKDRFQFIE